MSYISVFLLTWAFQLLIFVLWRFSNFQIFLSLCFYTSTLEEHRFKLTKSVNELVQKELWFLWFDATFIGGKRLRKNTKCKGNISIPPVNIFYSKYFLLHVMKRWKNCFPTLLRTNHLQQWPLWNIRRHAHYSELCYTMQWKCCSVCVEF